LCRMTTAHRATWGAARGGEEQGNWRLGVPSAKVSGKALPAQLTLKTRAKRHHNRDFVDDECDDDDERNARGNERKRLLREMLESGEREHEKSKRGRSRDGFLAEDAEREVSGENIKHAVENDDEEVVEQGGEDSVSDSEDDEEELLRELEKIREERCAARTENDTQHEDARENQARKLHGNESGAAEHAAAVVVAPGGGGNPLLSVGRGGDDASESVSGVARSEFRVRRRWNDDVVFRNQTRTADRAAQQPQFVNDTVRNEFHRRFMKQHFR